MPNPKITKPTLHATAALLTALCLATLTGTSPAGESAAINITGRRCTDCHQQEPVFSHPVNITPTRGVPNHLPLTGGLLTCATCHIPENHPTTSHVGKPNPLLRPTSGTVSFCTQCHEPTSAPASGLATAKVSHAASLSIAHLKSSRGVRVPAGQGRLDAESAACAACHDGGVGTDGGLHRGMDQSGDHPVGVTYRSAATELVPVARLDRRVRLFNQTVGCGSCHSVYSQEARLLVKSNAGSQLCLSCHVQ